MAALIALDWGTSSLRGFLLDRNGKVLETRASSHGIQKLPVKGVQGFRDAFAALCRDWVEKEGIRSAVAYGMVGSAQGWAEAPYLSCPADIHDLPSCSARVEAPLGVELLIAPGLRYDPEGGQSDVMRGEEIQLAGALARASATEPRSLMVLPGTHSKWVEVEKSRISSLYTYMTGELFSALRNATILGRMMPESGEPAPEAGREAFAKGVLLARESGPGDLAHQIFSARTMGLLGRIEPPALADYLSGIVIGHELISAHHRFGARVQAGAPLLIIGDVALCGRYIEGIRLIFGARPMHLGNTAPAGLFRFALEAGLLSRPSQTPYSRRAAGAAYEGRRLGRQG